MKQFLTCTVIFTFLFGVTHHSLGQRALIDSLEQNLSALPEANSTILDTTRINLQNHLAQLYLRVNPDKTIELSQTALELAKSIKFEKGISDAYNNLGVYNRAKGNYPKALEYQEKALQLFDKNNDLNNQAISLKNIGNVYLVQGQYEEALKFYLQSLEILEKTGDEYGLAAIYNNIGLAYKNQGDYNAALKQYEKSFEIF